MGRVVKTAFAIGILASAALGAAAVNAGAPSNRFAAELLHTHNAERAANGAPGLTWSPKLARQAQQWANVLAREGQMRHASQAERGGAGENLWMGSAGAYPASFMVQAFIEEKKHYRPGTFPKVSRTGNWRDVGHYTQVIWQETREVGCAIARGQRDDFLVCRYYPAGNTYGMAMK